MKDFWQTPPLKGKNEKVKAVKRSVISILRGLPLDHLADTLHDTNSLVNNQEVREICSADNCEKKSRREAGQKYVREVGDKDVQAAKRVL